MANALCMDPVDLCRLYWPDMLNNTEIAMLSLTKFKLAKENLKKRSVVRELDDL